MEPKTTIGKEVYRVVTEFWVQRMRDLRVAIELRGLLNVNGTFPRKRSKRGPI
jgi:hypothetical protein